MDIAVGVSIPATVVRAHAAATVPPAPATPLMIAGTNSRIGDTAITPTSGRTEFVVSTTHILGYACAAVAPNFTQYFANASAEALPSSGATIVKMALLWHDNGTKRTTPVTFGGSRGVVMAPDSDITADEITPASFGSALPAFPAGTMFQLRYIGQVTGGTGSFAAGTPATASPATTGFTASGSNYNNAQAYAPANRIDAVDGLGDMPNPTGQVGMNNIGLPTMFLGRAAVPDPVAVLVIGDSISVGLSEGANPMKTMAGYGYFDRAAVDASGYQNAVALAHQSRQTETLGTWMGYNNRRRKWLGYASVVILEHGTNDLASAGGGPGTDYTGVNRGSPLANLQYNYDAFWTLAKSYPSVKRIYQTNLLPRPSSSSDGWATKAGQTVPAGWASGGLRDALEAWWATKVSDGTIAGVIDVRTPVADAGDNHYWLTNGSAGYMTSDGTHPAGAGHALIAPAMRGALAGMAP